MLNFAVGPVMMDPETREIGLQEIPYFRTAEFSALMKENEQLLIEMMKAPEDSHCIFLTGSGTAGLESCVINCFDEKDKVLVINGGSFGHRFVELCELHEIPFEQIKLGYGQKLTENELRPFDNAEFTGLLVNMGETSTGVVYDMNLIGDFCKKNNMFLIADCVSSFLADEIDMEKTGINIAITGSQKALAVPPGIAVVVLDKDAVERVNKHNPKSMYFDFSNYLKNMERGQTPFTPAISTLIQINDRLKRLESRGGASEQVSRTHKLAVDFRERISQFGFKMLAQSPSNAVTALEVTNGVSAYHIFEVLKDEYDIYICPNGGELKEKVFRVGHIGNLTITDYDKLFDAFADLKKRGII